MCKKYHKRHSKLDVIIPPHVLEDKHTLERLFTYIKSKGYYKNVLIKTKDSKQTKTEPSTLTLRSDVTPLPYDKYTGLFSRLMSARLSNNGFVGSIQTHGYRAISVNSKLYRAHRLAWLYVYGEFPKKQIDHINGNRSDNRISNLRVVSQSGNSQNRRASQKNNQSGYFGVHACGKKWRAQIRIDKKLTHLGLFDTPELASMAYVEAKRSVHVTCTI